MCLNQQIDHIKQNKFFKNLFLDHSWISISLIIIYFEWKKWGNFFVKNLEEFFYVNVELEKPCWNLNWKFSRNKEKRKFLKTLKNLLWCYLKLHQLFPCNDLSSQWYSFSPPLFLLTVIQNIRLISILCALRKRLWKLGWKSYENGYFNFVVFLSLSLSLSSCLPPSLPPLSLRLSLPPSFSFSLTLFLFLPPFLSLSQSFTNFLNHSLSLFFSVPLLDLPLCFLFAKQNFMSRKKANIVKSQR